MTQPPDDNEVKKRVRIQRRRLGKIIHIDKDGSYGFIRAEDFRDDVFFHVQDWDGKSAKEGVADVASPEIEMWVEFELNEEHRETENRLRAKIVRPTDRPTGRKLSGRDATFNIVTHHPKARRKRPSWRK